MKLAGLAIGFLMIIALVIRKKPLALAMFAGTLVAGLSTGLGPEWLARTWAGTFVQRDTLELVAMVGCITLLSRIMAASGLHERLVNATVRLLRSNKLAIMVIPPLVGSMPIPGGAIVSAPLLDRPGALLGISQPRKAAINLVFRHANFFLLPFTSAMVLAAKLIPADLYTLLLHLAPLGLVIWIVGYFALIHGIKEPRAEGDAAAVPLAAEGTATGAPAGREFLLSASPVLLALVVGFALRVPFWAAVSCGILLALALTWRAHPWMPAELARGVDWKLIGAMFGIMGFRGVIVAGRSLAQLAGIFAASAVPLPVLGYLMAFLISTVSANHNTTLGVVYPMVLPLAPPEQVMAYAVLVFGGSFVAYFSSPLHLCQILTNQYCKVSLIEGWKEYWPVLVGVVAASWALFFLYLA